MDIDLLSKMVKELILDKDEVALPGVGTFVAEMVPSSFADRGYTILPPYRRLFFRQRVDETDTALIDFYATSNGIEEERARRIVTDFLLEMRDVLKQKKSIVFPGLGKLRATRENHFFFVADEDLDIYPAGYGLEPISLKTHQETPEEVSSVVEQLRAILTEKNAAPSPVEPVLEEEPSVEPEPVEAPIVEEAPAKEIPDEVAPVEAVPAEKPEPQAIVEESVRSIVEEPIPVSTVAEPAQEAKAAEPVQEAKAAEPAQEAKAAEPVQEAKAAEPAQEAKAAEPAQEAKAAEPAQEAKAAEPAQEAKAGEHVPAVKVEEPARRRGRAWLWVALGLLGLVVLALIVFVILAHVAPDFIDSLLYSPEELEILRYPV